MFHKLMPVPLVALFAATAWLGAPKAAQAEDMQKYYGTGYVDHLIQELLYARDDDDREDAAKDLGKIGDPRALDALQQAALYDDEDDVRDEARKAIRRIEERNAPRVVVEQPAPVIIERPAPVIIERPPVVYAPPRVVYAPPIVHRRVIVHHGYGYPVRDYRPRRGFGFSFHWSR